MSFPTKKLKKVYYKLNVDPEIHDLIKFLKRQKYKYDRI